jgi:dienelactone hydrolase
MHLLDRLLAFVLPRGTFFSAGWGEEALLVNHVSEELAAAPAPIAIAWKRARREGGLVVRDGDFESPDTRLPPEARLGGVRLLAPARGAPHGAVVLLAATGDQGFAARAAFARPLALNGLVAVLPETPFYGRRRRAGQRGMAPLTVSDLIVMVVAGAQEARALLARFRAKGLARLGVAGYSMGGNMAALVASSVPFEVAAVPMAPTCSPAPVFTEGLLRSFPDLRALGEAADADAARARLRARLAPFDVTCLPPPRAPRAAIVLGTRRDGFVPPSEAERLARHWGAELRWLDAGHVSAVAFHRAEMRQAVNDAFARLG